MPVPQPPGDTQLLLLNQLTYHMQGGLVAGDKRLGGTHTVQFGNSHQIHDMMLGCCLASWHMRHAHKA